MDLWVDLNRRGDRATAIYRALVAAMTDGRLRSGDRLPPMRALATDLAVSRTTVATVYERLTAEGYVEGRVGSGTFVTAAGGLPTEQPRRPVGQLQPKPGWTFRPSVTSSQLVPPPFDFRAGIPDPALFPFDIWRRLVAGELRLGAHQVGTYSEPSGHAGLRAAIAGHLGRSRSMSATADDVLVTNGTQQGLDLIARVLLQPGDVVAVEDPGYPHARELFAAHGATVAPVPVDAEGLLVQQIPPSARLVFSTPSHQFPLGVPMSLPRRRELIGWGEQHDAAIIEDDYDSEFRYTARPLEPLHAMDRSGRVIYAGTFSKSLLPSLRMGFLVVPESLRAALQAARQLTDWHGVTALQAALARFIDEGQLARHVRRASGVYQQRRDAVIDGVQRHLGEWLEVVPSAAGLHICARSRPGLVLDSAGLLVAARRQGITVEGLAEHHAMPPAGPVQTGLVIGYGMAQLPSIDAGLAVTGRLLRRFVSRSATVQ